MSRICVKNLPRYVGEDRLKDYFSRKGEITDVKIMRTKDGKSRQLAFIGFRTSAEAEEAIKFFHDSYLDTSRIKCEIAHKVGDPNIPRPWSRHSAVKKGLLSDNNSEGVGRTPKGSKGTVVGKEKTKKKENNKDADPQFEEFLQLMQPRIKSKLWANDTIEASVDIKTQEGNVRQDQVRNDSKRGTRKRDHSGPKDDPSMEGPVDRDNIVLAGDELRSNKDYYRGKAYKTRSDLDNDEEGLSSGSERDGGAEVYEGKNSEKFEYANVEASENVVPDVVDSVEKDSRREKVLETGRLFVRNLPYTSTEEDLEELFNKYGDVSQVHLVVDKHTNRSKGFAYVLYTTPECAVRALEDVDHSIFQGRLLHVMPAEQPPEQKEHKSFAGETSKTFKEQRLEKRKASEASGDTRAWNSFFMHSDTVAENIARRFGVSKSKLLDREADDLAVRLALGETQIIGETKKALANAGVNVKALEELASGKSGNDKRSNHVILVKNLPYSSSEEELVSMFSKFGSLDKVIVPPTKALALIIFLEASEARAAFKGLAYNAIRIPHYT